MSESAPVTEKRPEHQELFLEWIDVRLRSVVTDDPITVEVEVPLTDRTKNSAGVMNGGIVATLLDMAGGVAAARAAGSHRISTSSLNIQYVSPVTVGPAVARAVVVRTGGRSVVAEVRMVDAGDGDRVTAIGTISLVARKD